MKFLKLKLCVNVVAVCSGLCYKGPWTSFTSGRLRNRKCRGLPVQLGLFRLSVAGGSSIHRFVRVYYFLISLKLANEARAIQCLVSSRYQKEFHFLEIDVGQNYLPRSINRILTH